MAGPRPGDYAGTYDEYWSRADRIGESSGDLAATAAQVLAACGPGRMLDVGSGEGGLVAELLSRGVDAVGLDVSEVVVGRCNARMPGRFHHGSVLALPFADDAFDTVVSTDCLEHLAPADIAPALAELYRVARRYVFLKIATTQDRDGHWHLTVEGRRWWESRCFEAGFRKHPAYYRINDYEALNRDGWQIAVPLEKIPRAALERYPLDALEEERGLHMDMLRDSGERSDAHVARYQWACQYLRPEDRVLDAACGLGYGSHVVRALGRPAEVLGIDGGQGAVDYATASYADTATRFEAGMLPQALAQFPEGRFDAIISFETLEHVEDPAALLDEFRRVLSPGGRLIVSVPNDWSDETGRDPNPYHLQVYEWERLRRELGSRFIVEEAFAQAASRCKSPDGKTWEPRARSLRKVPLSDQAPAQAEWWLMSAMKTPLGATLPYREGVHRNLSASGHPSIDYTGAYRNPWLVYALVHHVYRLRDPAALERLAEGVMASSPRDSNDYAAALCVSAYRALEGAPGGDRLSQLTAAIDEVIARPPAGPMGLRWKVSLLFVKGRLLQEQGRFTHALEAYERCGREDVRPFGVHLATKATEAWFRAGLIALGAAGPDAAMRLWRSGVEAGEALLDTSTREILIAPDWPNLFNHGDGVREYALAWDNVARCANGIHLLKAGHPLDASLLEASFQAEYAIVRSHALECRRELDERTASLESATATLDRAARELRERTDELVETRKALAERTEELVETRKALADRTGELVQARELAVERTALLEQATSELVARTAVLDTTGKDLVERTEELVALRTELAQARAALQQAGVGATDLRAQLAALMERLQAAQAGLDQARQEHERIHRSPFVHAFKISLKKLIN